MRAICFEPFACHIALAISALTRVHYLVGYPVATQQIGILSLKDYADHQYARAVRCLNMRFDQTSGNAELAVLASILFINMEFLRGTEIQHWQESLVGFHIHGGLRILNELQCSTERPKLVCSWDLLERALLDMLCQLEQLHISRGLPRFV